MAFKKRRGAPKRKTAAKLPPMADPTEPDADDMPGAMPQVDPGEPDADDMMGGAKRPYRGLSKRYGPG